MKLEKNELKITYFGFFELPRQNSNRNRKFEERFSRYRDDYHLSSRSTTTQKKKKDHRTLCGSISSEEKAKTITYMLCHRRKHDKFLMINNNNNNSNRNPLFFLNSSVFSLKHEQQDFIFLFLLPLCLNGELFKLCFSQSSTLCIGISSSFCVSLLSLSVHLMHGDKR